MNAQARPAAFGSARSSAVVSNIRLVPAPRRASCPLLSCFLVWPRQIRRLDLASDDHLHLQSPILPHRQLGSQTQSNSLCVKPAYVHFLELRHLIDSNDNPYSAPTELGPSVQLRCRLREILRLWPITLPTLLLPLPAIFFCALATAPYRPPHDMSSLLGAGEAEAAYFLAAIFALVWLVCALVFARRLYKLFVVPQRSCRRVVACHLHRRMS